MATDPRQLIEPEYLLPFEQMRVGDSFFLPTLRPAEMVYVMDTRAKVAGVRVKSYPATKEGLIGIRVWRTR
jgi:hypothetical protein